jgi:hypothetical protein
MFAVQSQGSNDQKKVSVIQIEEEKKSVINQGKGQGLAEEDVRKV